MKIFVIEDEAVIRSELVQLLGKYGYDCESSVAFSTIAKDAIQAKPDLILLDINLPYQDGYHVCREIRKNSSVPVIVLTGRDTDFDELISLELGADDFMTKPYNAQILLARIQKALKKAYESVQETTLYHKGLTLYLLNARAVYEGKNVELTKNEMGILRLLMLNKGNIIPREAIIDELWQDEQFIDENTLNVNMVRLRRKLSDLGLPDYLETKRGMGYRV